MKQYGPLAEKLTEILGEKVVYQQPKGWLFYQRDMRTDKFDIVFDGPHFISWRIKRFGHTPVAKLPGKLSFIVVTAKDTTGFNGREVNAVDDLKNVTVCSIAPPNLSSLTVLTEYKDPVSLPVMVNAKGGMKGVYKAFRSGKCKAAILRDKFFAKKVPEEERENLKIIFKSKPVANQGITVSRRINEEQRILIASVLTEVSNSTAPTLKRFAPKADKMLYTDNSDYEDYYQLLTDVVYGWGIIEE
ncbi:MAG: PhnD/SsuA/transferrin family substrate-binding protein [Gammaproteobacteria bacterium]|nr:PhnD/SsuA/transferrin family substrate-binding protein [Gammaproteobacteria bacterium]